MAVRTFRARASAEAAARANVTSPFTIEVRFLGGLSASQEAAFETAATRWSQMIVGDLPNVLIEGEVVDDVLILAQGRAIDGVGGILGQAGPTRLRPQTAGQAAFLPARGTMAFDTADLDDMEQNGTLVDVITHEMGHVIGIGTIWDLKGLLEGAGTSNPTFVGSAAKAEFGQLKGTGPAPVPVENMGGGGTADSHWRETVFGSELMTGFVGSSGNPLGRLTVASLQDLGYVVDLEAAEEFVLPDLLELAESGRLMSPEAHLRRGVMLPIIPLLLPEESLQTP